MFIKRIALLCFLIAIVLSTAAQNIKDLYQQLSQAKNIKSKIDITNTIAYELRALNPDTAIIVANNNMLLAKEEHYENGEGTALLNISYAYITKAQYQLSYDYTQKAKVIAEKIKNDSLLAYCLLAHAVYHYNTSNYDNAIETALQAIKIFEVKKCP